MLKQFRGQGNQSATVPCGRECMMPSVVGRSALRGRWHDAFVIDELEVRIGGHGLVLKEDELKELEEKRADQYGCISNSIDTASSICPVRLSFPYRQLSSGAAIVLAISLQTLGTLRHTHLSSSHKSYPIAPTFATFTPHLLQPMSIPVSGVYHIMTESIGQ